MRIINVKEIDSVLDSLRPRQDPKLRATVTKIISDVQKRGDSALREYERKFGASSAKLFRVSPQEMRNSYKRVTKDQIEAIRIAKKRLETSEKVIRKKLQPTSIMIDGIRISKTFTPIGSVACYIPGGKARYPSTVVMTAVPASVAGVKRIVAVSPPGRDGMVDPLTLVAADICGVTEFYRMGGAQAIAALAFGTRSVPKVDKIVGPGGMFVTIAKSILSDVVSIDMVAGPTELAVIADSTASPDLVAVDLISQAEHSPDTACSLITNSRPFADMVARSLQKRMGAIPRGAIVAESLRNNGFIAVCKTESQMIDLANKLAPEHLEVMTRNPQRVAAKIKSAGLVLVGKETPSSASDYLLGSNHVLPTNGFGRTRGSLGVLDFVKLQTTVQSSKASLAKISRYMRALTDAEGLPNHYEAVRRRT